MDFIGPIFTDSTVPFILSIADVPSRFGERVLIQSHNAPLELRAFILNEVSGRPARPGVRRNMEVTIVRSSRGARETIGSMRPVGLTLAFMGEVRETDDIKRALDRALPWIMRALAQKDAEEALWAFSEVVAVLGFTMGQMSSVGNSTDSINEHVNKLLMYRLRRLEYTVFVGLTLISSLLVIGLLR